MAGTRAGDVMSALPRGAMSAAWGHGSLVRVPRPLSSLSHSVHSERLSFVCESGDGTREARVSDFYGSWRRGKTASRRAAFAPRLELLAARRGAHEWEAWVRAWESSLMLTSREY